MRFLKVEISDFRNLVSTSLHPSPFLNLISGSNGSGKSSLLEAIHYIATGSSFRTHRLSNVIHKECDCFTLFSEIDNSLSHRVGLKRCRDLNHLTRIDGSDVSRRSELVQLLPLQVISPESISLLLEGSEQRRNFIDWSLFHVEQSFHFNLSHYLRVLKQRNALLKSGAISDIGHWDVQMVEHGVVINQQRSEYIDSLIPIINDLMQQLLPGVELDIRYRSGWSSELSLEMALQKSRESDIKLKHTTVGPHRGDIVVKSRSMKVSESLSRGQLKLTVVAFKLAQIIHLQAESEKTPVILIDDLAAELDVEHRALLLDTVKSLNSQVFITTPELELIEHRNWDEKKVFHVEHGQVKEVV